MNDYQWFVVTLNGKRIDKVSYLKPITVEEVKRSLINHDGYDPGINVTKERKKRQ